MLFGATSCQCGYSAQAADEVADRSIELSYLEALRVYWRVYWPMQVVAMLGLLFLTGTLFDVLVQLVLAAAALLLFLGRIVSRPYRGFRLVMTASGGGELSSRLTFNQRFELWAFFWWRQMVAGVLAMVLALPLNAVLAMLGLEGGAWVGAAAGVLVIGPILVKMLIGHPFETFLVVAQRPGELARAVGR